MAMRSASCAILDRPRAVGDAAVDYELRRQIEAAAFLPDQVGRGHLDVVEVQDVRREGGQHPDRALFQSGRVRVDHEGADRALVALFARPGVDDTPVRVRDVACPHLLAVDDVAVSLALGPAPDGPRRIGPAGGLADRGERLPAGLARDHRRRVAVEELARRTEQHARRVPRERAERREVGAHPALRRLFGHHGLAKHAKAGATEFLGGAQRPQAEPLGLRLQGQQQVVGQPGRVVRQGVLDRADL